MSDKDRTTTEIGTSIGSGSPSVDSDKMSRYERFKHRMSKVIKDSNLEKASLQEKMVPGAPKGAERKFQLATNAFGFMNIQGNVYRYEVDIYGVKKSGRKVKLNYTVKDDVAVVLQREDARAAFESVTESGDYSDFFKVPKGASAKESIVFDLINVIYSKNKLDFTNISDDAKVSDDKQQAAFKIVPGSKGYERFDRRFDHVLFCVRDNSFEPLDVKKFEAQQVVAEKNYDTSGRLVLQAMTSQPAFHDREFLTYNMDTAYLLNPTKYGFQEGPPISANVYLGIGTQKVVHNIEGPYKKGATVAFISCKKTPFYNVGDLLTMASISMEMQKADLIAGFNNRNTVIINRMNKVIAGLYVSSRFDDTHVNMHKLIKVTNILPSEKKFPLEGNQVDIIQYYKVKYGYDLELPNAPLVEVAAEFGQPRGKVRGSIFFPLEVLQLCDNQRLHSQTPEIISAMIKECAVPPATNYTQILNARNAWEFEQNKFLEGLAIRVTKKPLVVDAHRLGNPGITYSSAVQVSDMAKWRCDRNARYLIPAVVEGWAYYSLGDRMDNRIEADKNGFLPRFLAECRNKGIQIPDPVDGGFVRATLEDMDRTFQRAVSKGAVFIMFVHDSRERKAHSIMKLLELKYEMLTQDLNSATVRNVVVKGQPMTVENIVNKTNIKNGGLNYTLTLNPSAFKGILSPHTLYIGFATSKPAGGLGSDVDDASSSTSSSDSPKKPQHDVIGYSANVLKRDNPNPFEFVGDFCYVDAGDENPERTIVCADIVADCVKRFKEIHGQGPQMVIVYRYGCSEGYYKSLAEFEVPLIDHKMMEANDQTKIPWAFIVPSKLHNARILKTEVTEPSYASQGQMPRAPDQNIAPGTVVDTSLVSPYFAEFYLCSHSALQGTAKVPRYTVLHNNCDLTLDDIERMTWNLSFGHQIVNLTVSLPAPMYIGNRYAERGRMLYNQAKLEGIEPLPGYRKTQYLANYRLNA